MSIKKALTTAVLAAAGVVLSALPAKALVYSSGDIFLGIRATGGTGNTVVYLVNLGQDTQFNGVGSAFAGTSIGADLTALYGDGWNTRTDLYWGVFGARGTTGSVATLYASREATSAGEPSDSWAVLSSSVERGNTLSAINSARNAWVTSDSSGPTSYVPVNLQGGIQSSTYDSGYYSQVASDPNFGSTSQWSNIESSFASESAGAVLDLFRVTGSANTTGYLGYFSIDDSGFVSFTTTAVPEPSTVAMLALAGIGFVILVRRRQVRA